MVVNVRHFCNAVCPSSVKNTLYDCRSNAMRTLYYYARLYKTVYRRETTSELIVKLIRRVKEIRICEADVTEGAWMHKALIYSHRFPHRIFLFLLRAHQEVPPVLIL